MYPPPIAVETRRRSRDDNLFGDTTKNAVETPAVLQALSASSST